MSVIQHPLLGYVRGRQQYGSVDFRGLKYASLESKMAPSVLYECSQNKGTLENPLDATKTGPCVISPPEACNLEWGLLQHELPLDEVLIQSDVECLNLNVAVPEPVQQKRSLPVMVFIHGGGLNLGSANWPQNSLARFVSYSAEMGKPIIAVSINYRVGPIGFLTSEELRHAGYPANNGLRDQRVALLWIKKFISGFGGNPEEMCVIGQSAGGVSATLHLASEEPLFKRLVSLSGTFLAVKPVAATIHEELYRQAIQILGLEELQSQERVKALQSMDASEIVAKLSMSIPALPMVDGDICQEAPTFTCLKGGLPKTLNRGWCTNILVGYCEFDGSIMALALGHRKAGIASSFASSLNSSLSDLDGAASSILEAYNIGTDGQMDGTAALLAILSFCGDITFKASALALAEGWQSRAAYLSQFSAVNPWPGPWQGRASHITDIAHLFQNYHSYLPRSQQKVGHEMGTDIIRFVYGQAPWPSVEPNQPMVKVFSNTGVQIVKGGPAQDTPIWNLIQRFTADRLLGAVENFLAGR